MHASVGRVVTTRWGQVFLDAPLERCYERNQAWAIGDADGLDAAALHRDIDRLFSTAGLGHRRVLVEPPGCERLAAGLVERGYDRATHVYLVHDGTLPPAPRADVREVGADAIAAANERYLRTDPDTAYGRDVIVRTQIVEHHRTYGRAGSSERGFAVLDGDDVVAWAKLWVRGSEAQVEDVVCLAEHRGRGYGRDVVAAATRAALAGDPELLFIVADAADWPQRLYAKLGYADVGHVTVHTRHEPGFAWGAPVPR
jgi:GNAT superfamily N-acetyltransferase